MQARVAQVCLQQCEKVRREGLVEVHNNRVEDAQDERVLRYHGEIDV